MHNQKLNKSAVILSDIHRGSFSIVGNLYESTFEKLGIEVSHIATPTSNSERRFVHERFRGSVFFHNTVGRNFKPFAGEYNIALVLHEWSRYPEEWIPYLNEFDQIWVTTRHLERVLDISNVTPPINVIPPALDLEKAPVKSKWNSADPFRFLYIGETHFRKGLHLLFSAWKHAFPDIGEAHLTLKTSPNCSFASPREDIEIISENWSRQDVLKLYTQYDCLVSASLGEGWGLPVAEAIRAQLPVTANLWGGHESMLSSKNCFAIPHQEIHQPYSSVPELYAPGQQCGFSEPQQIADTLKRTIQSTPREREMLAHIAVSDLWKHYSLGAIADSILDRMLCPHA